MVEEEEGGQERKHKSGGGAPQGQHPGSAQQRGPSLHNSTADEPVHRPGGTTERGSRLAQIYRPLGMAAAHMAHLELFSACLGSSIVMSAAVRSIGRGSFNGGCPPSQRNHQKAHKEIM
eukprot:COSAG01_NODE_5493_length_4227_cov_2.861192_4_plen_119_part_00